MYIGTQFGCRHDTDIQVLAQLGVKHVDQTPAERGRSGARTRSRRYAP